MSNRIFRCVRICNVGHPSLNDRRRRQSRLCRAKLVGQYAADGILRFTRARVTMEQAKAAAPSTDDRYVLFTVDFKAHGCCLNAGTSWL